MRIIISNLIALLSVLAVQNASSNFDPQANIGRDKKLYSNVSGVVEVCVLPKQLNSEFYSEKDLEKELKLCSLDFHSNQVALCPKYSSTSAATYIYELQSKNLIDSTNGKPKFQTTDSCYHLGSKKYIKPINDQVIPDRFGKFKVNETKNKYTITNISSPLAYYHLSKALGDILKVPTAVIRTLEVEKHLELVPLFLAMPKRSPGTELGWTSFEMLNQNGRMDKSLYTVDRKQIYGVLMKGGGTDWAMKLDEMSKIMQTSFYKKSVATAPMQNLFSSSDSDSTVRQETLLAADFADMVLLDTLLEQNDRYSGQNVDQYFEYWNGQEYWSQKKYEKQKETALQSNQKWIEPLKLTRLSIQDNDAGLLSSKPSFEKNIKNWNRLATIKHFSTSTYQKLQKLAQMDSSYLENFFQQETLMSLPRAQQVVRNIQKAATDIKQACLRGEVFVDLDVDLILAKQATLERSQEICEMK